MVCDLVGDAFGPIAELSCAAARTALEGDTYVWVVFDAVQAMPV